MANLEESDREFVRLMAANQHRIGAYIFTLVPNRSDADELLQETHVRLWEERDRFEPGTDFRAWALRVAYFEVLTWRKRSQRRPLIFNDELVMRLSESMIQQETHADEQETALRDCLDELSGRSRELLRRVYAKGEKIKDIATDLGTSADSMYKTVQRLRHGLRQCIEQRLTEGGAR
ncbi:sigma-70 family RNA polymerase sigma factor [Botrimarina sp.]|uniref:sigma-70 family RNA polymerase sigma factor n=1 Tax=Botrimarina sp. TaxID=2795802 RepID=UPI0032EF9597